MKVISPKILVSLLLSISFISSSAFAGRFIQDSDLWKHVVTVDRLAWQEREGIKKVNKPVDEQNFVRRIYLDVTGKIPTYNQMLSYLKSKDINKRGKLIDELLTSAGYVSNFSNFWLDLLRNPYNDPEDHEHREFTRYIERVLFENQTVDKFVYDMMTADGTVQENQAIGFYMRDEATGPMDTLNATVRAFLGTRIGCAQCHNHRFDKWTQKEFYESAAHMTGIRYGSTFGNGEAEVMGTHRKAFMKDKRFSGKLSSYSKMLFSPSRAKVSFNANQKLKYPDNYAYQNAKPDEEVQERIVFGYGDEETKVEGKDKREKSANWLTSKNNPMFARILANRLWKRIMGVAIMEPVDDWKDNVTVQNPHLFTALGDIFSGLNYDLKAFFSVILNSEAYQMAVDTKNKFKNEDYKLQGSILKRMSSAQLSDSLLTLRHGNLDAHAKLDDQYFEFEDKLNKLANEYSKEIVPLAKAHVKQYARDTEEIEPKMLDVMFTYLEKLREIEDYYDVGLNGYINKSGKAMAAKAPAKKGMNMREEMMMQPQGSSTYNANGKMVMRANYASGDFMKVFGSTDRSSPDTNVEMGATMKQILKMINSPECHNVVKKDSFLMKEMWKKEKITEKISYLYYSIYGRAPTKKDVNIAAKFFDKSDKPERWSKYALALINSPEFYFIK